MRYSKYILALAIAALVIPSVIPASAFAADVKVDQITTVKAKVVEVIDHSTENVAGTTTNTPVEDIKVEPLEGAEKGQDIIFKNDYTQLSAGDTFYLTKTVSADNGMVYYTVGDAYRLNTLWLFIGLFVILVIIFGGKQGVRGLLSLIGSLVLILFVYLPGILHGFSPILLSIGIASLIIILGSYVTHGFNKTTSAAVLGMIITVCFTGALAHWAISSAKLSGFENEEAVYLNFDTSGQLNFVGLLLGGMLIGLLGVLYDAAISQAIAVEELHEVAPHLARWTIYKRAIRIGKEHIGALVNTLAIAYVGVSLPLLLLFSTSNYPVWQIVNRENFSTEILRTMIGSIGLVLAVPITTLLAVVILIKRKTDATPEELSREEERLSHFEHHH